MTVETHVRGSLGIVDADALNQACVSEVMGMLIGAAGQALE
jgi:hypothetical protein